MNPHRKAKKMFRDPRLLRIRLMDFVDGLRFQYDGLVAKGASNMQLQTIANLIGTIGYREEFPEDYRKTKQHNHSNLTSGETKWGAIIEANETDYDFFFFVSNKVAILVPKRVLAVEQINLLRDLAKKNLGDRAKF